MTAYYNEIDPFAAAWLRELIKAGHIAPGDVDTRSIVDVRPDDLRGYTQCHFFAGIGVWSYALRLAGWPDDRSVWTGSCPCQPFSQAGQGGGFDDERHLWPHWHHLIRERRPPVVFGEQVASKDGLGWLDLVQSDLEGSGYAAGAVDLCAAGVGAPHIRQRLWLVAEDELANTLSAGRPEGRPFAGRGSPASSSSSSASWMGYHHHQGLEGQRGGHQTESGWLGSVRPVAAAGELGRVADPRLPEPSRRDSFAADDDRCGGAGLFEGRQSASWCADGGLADADDGCEPGLRGRSVWTERNSKHGERVGRVADCVGNGRGTGRHRSYCWHDGAQLDADGRNDRPGPTNGFWGDVDWLHCRDGKWRPVEPGTFPLAHGAPARVGRLRGYGNAIVAQVAATIVEAYLDTETLDLTAGGHFRLTELSVSANDIGRQQDIFS